MPPSVSVIVPCCNAAPFIGRAIESALGQAPGRVDVIVIDDGSTDGSVELIRAFGGRIRWEHGDNRGAPEARNRGLARSDADYVLFLDADDHLEPGAIAAWLAAADGADLCIGRCVIERDGTRRAIAPPADQADADEILRMWLRGWYTPPCAMLWRRSFIQRVGGWTPGLLRNQDGDLAMRALLHRPRIAVAAEGLAVHEDHASPMRISRRTGELVYLDEMEIFQRLWRTAIDRGRSDLQLDFARAFYRTGYRAFAHGVDHVGSACLRRARQMGLVGHFGPGVSKALSTLLGLRLCLTVLRTGRAFGREVDRRRVQGKAAKPPAPHAVRPSA